MAKSDKLFVTDAECAERIGVTTDQFKLALLAADKAGFPQKIELFANRRYWPAVRAWLDGQYGVATAEGYWPDEPEPFRKNSDR